MNRKVISLTLALTLLFSLACSASEITPRRIDETSYASSLLQFVSTTAQCNAVINGKDGTTRITATVTLEKADAVSGEYRVVTSWTQTVYSDRFTLDRSVPRCTSGDYRLVVTATVYGSSGSPESVRAASYAPCF